MGKTIIEKILARAAGGRSVAPGDAFVVDVDITVLIDSNFFPVYWREIRKVADPKKIVVVFDHRIPAPDRTSARAHAVGREFVKRFGIERFHDVGPDQGISHVIAAEWGYALPGSLLVCSDSHTGSVGAFNCAGRGIGGADVVYAAITGETWFRMRPTIRYDIVGKLRPEVVSKDVFLSLAHTYGDHRQDNVEFGGPALADLSLDARRTISTMATELNAGFVVFEPDDLLIEYVRKRNPSPFEPQWPDPDATYKDHRVVDLSAMEPLVALPDAIIGNVVPVGQAAGEPIQQAFIGSCANGSFDDLEIAARVLAGHRVAAGVRLLITPASQAVYRQALKAGLIEVFTEAGAIVTSASCGVCAGGHLGVLGPNETCITASTRNLKGRMGDPTACIYMASPATVAASAIAGAIAHPGEFIGNMPS